MSDPFATPGPYDRQPASYGDQAAFGGPGYGYPQAAPSGYGYPQAPAGQPPVHPLYGQLPPTGPVFLPPEASARDAYWDGTRAVRVLASPGRRLAARALDSLISGVVFYLILLLFIGIAVAIDYDQDEPGPVAIFFMILGGLAALAWLLLYDAMFVRYRGGTPGKLAVGVRVVRAADGWRWPTMWMALRRNLVQGVLGLTVIGGLIDSLWLLWDGPLHQCLHDKGAGTLVVVKEGMPAA